MKKLLAIVGIVCVLGSSEVSAGDGILVKGGAAAAAVGAGSVVIVGWPLLVEAAVWVIVLEGAEYVIDKMTNTVVEN